MTSESAVAFFTAALSFQTDVSDVHAELGSGSFVLVDSRGDAAWRQGRVPGALHLPTSSIAARAPAELDPAVPVVTYCWGPGCNGATRAALEFARLGFGVKEMIGGIEYWIREGLPLETDDGVVRQAPDPLTVPVPGPVTAVSCDC
ncbi:rhodanese-like domain-containing protein [Flindersiella endophytica]